MVSEIEKKKSTPKKSPAKKIQKKVASVEAPKKRIGDSDSKSAQSTRKRKTSGKGKFFRPKVRKDYPILKRLMDEPTNEKSGSFDDNDDMSLSKMRRFVKTQLQGLWLRD